MGNCYKSDDGVLLVLSFLLIDGCGTTIATTGPEVPAMFVTWFDTENLWWSLFFFLFVRWSYEPHIHSGLHYYWPRRAGPLGGVNYASAGGGILDETGRFLVRTCTLYLRVETILYTNIFRFNSWSSDYVRAGREVQPEAAGAQLQLIYAAQLDAVPVISRKK